MIFHIRVDDGVLVPTAEVFDWAAQVMHDYSGFASVLREGVHDVTPHSFEGGSNRHRVRVLPDGTAVYGVYRGEELQEPLLLSSESGQKTQVISPSSPILLISQKTRTPEVMFILAIIFDYPEWVDSEVDLSLISKN